MVLRHAEPGTARSETSLPHGQWHWLTFMSSWCCVHAGPPVKRHLSSSNYAVCACVGAGKGGCMPFAASNWTPGRYVKTHNFCDVLKHSKLAAVELGCSSYALNLRKYYRVQCPGRGHSTCQFAADLRSRNPTSIPIHQYLSKTYSFPVIPLCRNHGPQQAQTAASISRWKHQNQSSTRSSLRLSSPSPVQCMPHCHRQRLCEPKPDSHYLSTHVQNRDARARAPA